MVRINPNYDTLSAGYLFPEIAKRTRVFQASHPDVKILRLGIGNTTEPLTPTVIEGLSRGVGKLAAVETYTGYGDEQGDTRLRIALAERYSKIGCEVQPDEIFVSDGAKCDAANIQSVFGLESVVAIQDPAYPVYVDTNVIAGRALGKADDTGRYPGFVYMPCTAENGFIPRIPERKVDIIYLCSPNNPTGAVMSHKDLAGFVNFARENKAVIIFDAAYDAFISNRNLPRSIYEVSGAKECAIEINSFSKPTGFTGVRLGWTVVPKDLVTEDSVPGGVNGLWNRRSTTFFNGASNVVQEGGLAALTPEGMEECQRTIDYYMTNARVIREGMQRKGFRVFGGDNAPYIWMRTPGEMRSWDFFDKLLSEAYVVCTPGVGFGPSGEGFVRLSSFGHRENIEEAVASIEQNLKI